MGILIGKRGQTLDSLQYLTSLVVNKGKADYIRVKLDTEDYRRNRGAVSRNGLACKSILNIPVAALGSVKSKLLKSLS